MDAGVDLNVTRPADCPRDGSAADSVLSERTVRAEQREKTTTMTTNISTQNSTPKTSRRLVAAIVAGGVAIAGLTAAVTMTLETPSAHAQTTPPTSSSSGSDSHHGSSTPGGHHHSHHAVTPSQSIKTLQSQLAQLNYYDGPISGYWNADTTNAVDYLQASAHLAQTGTMNAATQAALEYQLAHGDNQMGS